MPNPTLSPKEQKQVERYIRNVTRLSRRVFLNNVSEFIMRQQLRRILESLGADYVSRVMSVKALDIIHSYGPIKFKVWRLKRLISHD